MSEKTQHITIVSILVLIFNGTGKRFRVYFGTQMKTVKLSYGRQTELLSLQQFYEGKQIFSHFP